MSDPFSIASGAVGIISLGIQFCKEITKYTEAWRGYDWDIESINLKAKSLETPLKRLREFVEDTRLTDAETANDIVEKTLELDRHLKRLKDRLLSVQPIISESLADQVRNKLRRAAYPLRAQDALRDIETDLDRVQSTIELALTIFNAQQAHKLHSLQEQGLQLLEKIHLAVSTTPRKDMAPPALLKSLCDCVNQCSDLSDPNSQYNSITRDDNLNMYAAARLSTRTLYTRRASSGVSTKTLFRYYSGWLHRQLTLSFSLSTGAGAFSIGPVLEVQVYRGEKSWLTHKNFYPMRMDIAARLNEKELIRDFQQAISAGEIGPYDIVPRGMSIVSWVFDCCNIHWLPGTKPAMSNFLRAMIEAGFKLNNGQERLLGFLFDYKWSLHDETFALVIIDHGLLIDWFPQTRQAKENMRRLLVRDNDLGDLPEIAKIILRESALDLREALQSGLVKSNDVMKFTVPKGSHYVRHLSLLELAVGWPKGVFILLEFGADALEVDLRRCPYRTAYADDLDCDDFRDSLAPLLQRGCVVRSEDIHQCNSKTIRALLINELTNRRKRLHDVARSCLPPSRFAEITGPGIDESIIDVHAFQIYAELIATNLMVDRSLECDATSDAPVYHHKNYEPYATLNAWDDLYLAGFRDVDLPDSRGLTPLMVAGLSPEFAENRVIWLVGKGASLSKRIPFSNTTVAHLMTSRLFRKLFEGLQFGVKYDQGDHMSPKSINYHKHTIFLFPSIRDCCTCFCSDGGCTTLSVALRECSASYLHQWTPSTTPSKSSYIFGLQSLIDLREETQERDHTIIRFLTFEALGLRHTCCREIMNIGYFENYARDIMDENEVRNIQEEDQHRYQQLDELVEDLKTRFDDLRLPIIDFLDGPWYARMAQVLSARDPYDEEHILQNRNNGIFLEPVESHDIPPFFSIFSSQIQELETEVSIAGNGDSGGKDKGSDQSRNSPFYPGA